MNVDLDPANQDAGMILLYMVEQETGVISGNLADIAVLIAMCKRNYRK